MKSTILRLLPTTWFLFVAVSTWANDASVTPKELDARIDRAIMRTINTGAPIFNQGDQAGCYRLYQGALMVIEPMLGHRPELRQEVARGLKDVEFVSTYIQRAIELRRILDRVLLTVRKAQAPAPAPAPTPIPPAAIPATVAARTPTTPAAIPATVAATTPTTAAAIPAAAAATTSPGLPPKARSLWARLGGESAVRAVVHDFVELAAKDPQVDFNRGGKYALDAAALRTLESRLVAQISAGSGGPLKYEGRDMKSAHKGMAITDSQFDAMAGDLSVVLVKREVPQAESDELLAIIAATRKDIVEGPTPSTPPPPPPPPTRSAATPLWTRLGGKPAVKLIVHDFIALAVSDSRVDFTRGDKYPLNAAALANLETHLITLISAVSGGPLKYEGRDMKSLHRGMAITDVQFDAMVSDLDVVLKNYQVSRKEADELMAIIVSTRKDVVQAS